MLSLLLLLVALPLASAVELPGDSIYRLPLVLVDQNGHAQQLVERRGKPQLISMFYTSCQYVCPLIIDSLRKTRLALTPAERSKLDVLLVSFDPERDTPARLKQVFAERKLDASGWTLARTDAADVRKLAAMLDIQYRALASGDFNHSTALILLDADGRVVARTDKLGAADAEFVAAIQRTLVPR
ncbi:MAG: SCO family protein [Rudaea sp.]|nr:SCO family protein [Rudaea sp.]